MMTMIIMVEEVISFNEKMGIRNKNSKNDKHKCLKLSLPFSNFDIHYNVIYINCNNCKG